MILRREGSMPHPREAVDESWRLLRFNLLPVPFGTRIRVHIGDPIARHPDADPSALLDEARQEIEKKLEAWRSGQR